MRIMEDAHRCSTVMLVKSHVPYFPSGGNVLNVQHQTRTVAVSSLLEVTRLTFLQAAMHYA